MYRKSKIFFYQSIFFAFNLLNLHAEETNTNFLEPPPPEVVEKQLRDAEAEFKEAKKMFNPWYAGPLLTPSPHILPPGLINIQPYLFLTNNYARFNQSGSSRNIPNLHQINALAVFQAGVVKRIGAVFIPQWIRNSQSGHYSNGMGDTKLALQYEIFYETPYTPALLFQVQETFPTGKYQHLNGKKGGVDALGAGAYETTFSLTTGKVVWWISTHPMNLRLSLNYGVPTRVHVKGFNAYGGGNGTNGKANPGNNFTGDLGVEYSFTQRWVLALDTVYTYTSRTTFKGRRGFDAAGKHNVVGGPFNDQLSLAPALEYNPNENLGYLVGAWCSVWGRNSFNFYSGVFTVEFTF